MFFCAINIIAHYIIYTRQKTILRWACLCQCRCMAQTPKKKRSKFVIRLTNWAKLKTKQIRWFVIYSELKFAHICICSNLPSSHIKCNRWKYWANGSDLEFAHESKLHTSDSMCVSVCWIGWKLPRQIYSSLHLLLVSTIVSATCLAVVRLAKHRRFLIALRINWWIHVNCSMRLM